MNVDDAKSAVCELRRTNPHLDLFFAAGFFLAVFLAAGFFLAIFLAFATMAISFG